MSGFGGTFSSDWFAGFWEGKVTALPEYHSIGRWLRNIIREI